MSTNQLKRCSFCLLFFLIIGISGLNAQIFYYSKPTGNLNLTTTWGLNTDGSGIQPLNFTLLNQVFIITNRSSATIGAAWTVSGIGSRVQLGDGSTNVEFTIPAAFAFSGTIDVTNSATLTNLNAANPTLGTLSAGSTVNYAGTINQTVLSAAYYNLSLGGSGQKLMANTASSSVSNLLDIGSGVSFRLHTNNTLSVTLTGSLTGAGAILGNANSNLVINGTGNFGTLTFTTTLTLFQLIINRAGSGTVTLGSNLTVNNAFTHSNGLFELNGRSLTLNNAITFPSSISNGAFIGSASSSLAIAASTATITNSLLMSQSSSNSRTLNRFTYSRTGQTLVLGNSLIVVSNFVQSLGNIQLNNQSLTIGGIISFPTSIANGVFIGSTTSTLIINGSGAITNTLKFDQTNAATRSLHSFTVDHTGGTITFGTSFTSVSNFVHSNGPIALGANLLSLDGNITFPLTATNGSITGSATSSISIGGAGSITNSLFMRQNNAASRTLNSFVLNRASQTLALGSPLIVNSFNHTNGNLNLNGTLLTLNGAITFPASISNGAFVGSTTSSLVIGTSASTITNAILLNQATASTRALSQFSFNRTTQTLFLGNNLTIVNSFAQTNGNININGQLLSISGLITFPVAIANGAFVSTVTSSLNIGGAGAIANTLKFDQTNITTRTLHSFTVDHTGGTVSLGNNLSCSNNFVHLNGPLTIGTTSLTLDGNITFPVAATNGSFTGSATSSLSIGGSGSITNSLFMSQASAAARTFNSFSLNRTAQTLALGNALIINTYNQTNGSLNLNGNLLTLNGAITLPATITNGAFIGSNTSSIVIATSASTITNAIRMNQSTSTSSVLSQFSISRTTQTLVIGSNMSIINNFVHINGRIDLNGQLFSIAGLITFPVAIANGAFVSTASSSLNIGGAGVITNTLKFDQTNATTRTLHSFTVNHTGGTVSLGNNLSCSNNFVHLNGPVTIGTTSLTLDGNITFPVAATNGSFTGSATSSLSIGGSGSITNSLFMSQASAAARTFNSFSLNRVGQSLVLGNALIANVYTQTNGNVNLNGTLLTLNSVITFPASVSNGVFIGSLTSSLSIAGTGVITNALLMSQTNSTTRSLYDLTLNRTGQTLNIGNALEIRNSITPTLGSITTGGFVTLKSDATRSAMVGVVGGALTGNLSVESYAPGGFTGWTNLGPSGVSGLTVANWENQINMSCISCPNNEYSAGGYFVSIQSYSEAATGTAAYVPMTYTSSLTQGRGYWVYMGTGQNTTSAITYSVNGPAVTGNVVIPLTRSANTGFNLVSNPYPAPIDWDLVTVDAANSNVSGSVYFYNPDLAVSISYAAGVSNPSGYIVNGIIPMGQGFYVQANTGTNITFRETHKSTANTSANPLLKTQQNDSIGTIFRLSITGSNLDYDETTFRFHNLASKNFDNSLDAVKIFQTPGYVGTTGLYSKYTTISSRLGNDDYAINSLPKNQTEPVNIPILVKVMSTGTYVIAPVDLQNLPSTSCVMLKDKLLNVSHDLRNGPYTCQINDTTSVPRFELIICELTTNLTSYKLSGSNNIRIGQTGNSELTVFAEFEKDVNSTIRVYNVLGQKVIEDIEINGAANNTKLNLSEVSPQVLIIKVSNELGTESRKVYLR